MSYGSYDSPERVQQRQIEELNRTLKTIQNERLRARAMSSLADKLLSRWSEHVAKGAGKNWTFWRRHHKDEGVEKFVLSDEERVAFGQWLSDHSNKLSEHANKLEARLAAGAAEQKG